MNLVTKVTGVGVSAVLVVGLMGMSQASGDHSASTSKHDGVHGVVGATGGALSDAKVERQRAKGTLTRLFGRVDADRSITISDNQLTVMVNAPLQGGLAGAEDINVEAPENDLRAQLTGSIRCSVRRSN